MRAARPFSDAILGSRNPQQQLDALKADLLEALGPVVSKYLKNFLRRRRPPPIGICIGRAGRPAYVQTLTRAAGGPALFLDQLAQAAARKSARRGERRY
ncbi:MAG: hypothetical protein R2911_18825 [Caldilineaceae bacterium]